MSTLKRYILHNLSRREILDSVSRDYAQYAWSIATLSRRLAYFEINYAEHNTDLKASGWRSRSSIAEWTTRAGPAFRLPPYATQDTGPAPTGSATKLVYDLMTELNLDGLEQRGSVPVKVPAAPLFCFLFPSVRKRKHKRGAAGNFTSMLSFFFVTADSSAHNLCSEILIFFYLEVKPLGYALHIVPVRRFLFCISIVVLTENVIRDLCCNVLGIVKIN